MNLFRVRVCILWIEIILLEKNIVVKKSLSAKKWICLKLEFVFYDIEIILLEKNVVVQKILSAKEWICLEWEFVFYE